MRIITLTTDFGLADGFSGTIKGVILTIHPRATVVDITHGVPAGDIRAGAFALATSFRYFPRGTIHVAVVDPGVGSARRAIAVETARAIFVGPDNGVLSWALTHEKIRRIHQIENEKYFQKPVSRTFHGRDIFAPVAAHLSSGQALPPLEPKLSDYVKLPWPQFQQRADGLEGEAVYLDHFGNAITNIPNAVLPAVAARVHLGPVHPEVGGATQLRSQSARYNTGCRVGSVSRSG